jgi:hypothetical protein
MENFLYKNAKALLVRQVCGLKRRGGLLWVLEEVRFMILSLRTTCWTRFPSF